MRQIDIALCGDRRPIDDRGLKAERQCGGAPTKPLPREPIPKSIKRMSVEGEQSRSVKLDKGEVGSLKKGSLAVHGLQEGWSSERLLSVDRMVKDEVGDPSKAPASASQGSPGDKAYVARWLVGTTSLQTL